MLYCEKCGEWVEYYPMFGRKQHCLICNSKLRKESKIKIDISKLEKQMRIRDALAENPDIQPSIQCDKCHKRIEYNYYSGYGHRCSGRAEEIRRAVHRRFYSINRIQHFGVRSYEMARLSKAIYSVSTMYDPEADKLLRKEIEMKKTVTDLPTPEEITRIFRTLDLASKLDSATIAKLSSSKGKSSTPRIGELCGMDLLIDLSNAPDEAKYELYFKARTILEDISEKFKEV